MAFPIVLVVFLGGWFLVRLARRHLASRRKHLSHEYNDKEGGQEAERIEVLIPDMFQSFLKQPPRVNPHYETVKLESEKWINEFCSFDARTIHAVHKCGFSYFVSIAAPDAPPTELRTLCDWGNWVFPYDDMFDEGHLRDQPEQSQKVMDSLMAAMEGRDVTEPKLPIVKVHDSVVERIAAKCSRGTQRRFAVTMGSYCSGALKHVNDTSSQRVPTLEEMVMLRRESAGVSPLYHLVEYAHDLKVPEEVFNDPNIQELETLGIDMVSIVNDTMSYRKEEGDGVPHNMVAACRRNGMSAQEAFDTVGELFKGRCRRWDLAEARVRSFGENVDPHVKAYIEGIKNTVKANLYWSFKSQRYFGRNADEVRRTRKTTVLAQPSFLVKAKV